MIDIAVGDLVLTPSDTGFLKVSHVEEIDGDKFRNFHGEWLLIADVEGKL